VTAGCHSQSRHSYVEIPTNQKLAFPLRRLYHHAHRIAIASGRSVADAAHAASTDAVPSTNPAGGDMGRKKVEAASLTLTAQRAARFYRLLTLLGDGPQTRQQLLRRLKIDVRGFYRDLETLKQLGIEVSTGDDNRYSLLGDLDDAMARLPFPDPGLNFRDVQQLAKGDTAAHRKLKQRINSILGTSSKSSNPNKPR
jgi:hypothetical protein